MPGESLRPPGSCVRIKMSQGTRRNKRICRPPVCSLGSQPSLLEAQHNYKYALVTGYIICMCYYYAMRAITLTLSLSLSLQREREKEYSTFYVQVSSSWRMKNETYSWRMRPKLPPPEGWATSEATSSTSSADISLSSALHPGNVSNAAVVVVPTFKSTGKCSK